MNVPNSNYDLSDAIIQNLDPTNDQHHDIPATYTKAQHETAQRIIDQVSALLENNEVDQVTLKGPDGFTIQLGT